MTQAADNVERWDPILIEDFTSDDALKAWRHEGNARIEITPERELFIEVGDQRADGAACPWSTLWHAEPIWGDLRYVIRARGEQQGMRLFFFNAQALSDSKSIFEWERDLPSWGTYVAEPRSILYTIGLLRFADELNLRCIGGPLVPAFNDMLAAEAGSAEKERLLHAYREKEVLSHIPTPYGDPDKPYTIDIRVVGHRLRVLIDDELIIDVDDELRRDAPLRGGYFGLRNFEAGTRTWYDRIEVHRLR